MEARIANLKENLEMAKAERNAAERADGGDEDHLALVESQIRLLPTTNS